VAQGKKYQAGEAEFDRFFGDLHTLQVSMGEGPQKQQEAVNALKQELELAQTAGDADIGRKVQRLVDAMSDSEVRVHFKVNGAAGSVETEGRPLDRAETRTIEAMTRATDASAKLLERSKAAATRANELSAQQQALRNKLSATFQGQGNRKLAEVRENLDDAQKVLNVILEEADKRAKGASALLATLKDAIGVPPPPPPEPEPEQEPEEQEEEEPPKKGPKPRSSGATAATPAPAPPKPKPTGDFEP
jgi:hypothetical protein